MLRKNTAGQHLGFALVSATTGAALTGATVTVSRVIDGGAQATATGTTAEKGLGQYDFAPSQADTNGNQISYLFTASGAVPVEKTVVTTAADPTNATTFGLGNLDAAVSSRSTYAGGAVASVSAPVTVNTVNDKTGYSLAAAGLDAITATDPSGVPTTFRDKLLWLYRRFARSSLTASTLLVKNASGATITTQTVSDDGTTQTVGEPS
jgi:hypothetical protein